MRLLELAAQGLLRRRLRSIITLASVVVGTTGLLLFVAVAAGLQQQLQLQLGTYEPATVLHLDPPLAPAASAPTAAPPTGIDDALLGQLRALPHVSSAFAELQVGGTARLAQTDLPLALRPVPASYLRGGAGVRLLAGRDFGDDQAHELVITAGFASVLSGGGADSGPSRARAQTAPPDAPAAPAASLNALIGQTLQFTADGNDGSTGPTAAWQIVGVVDGRAPFAYVPYDAGLALQPRDPSGVAPSYDAAVVQVASVQEVAAVRQEVEALHLHIETPETLAKSLSNALSIARFVAAVIAVIGLLLAVINITNTLLAAVSERAREIGIMKAVGARNWHVGTLFLLESLLLGLLGGAVGSVTALLLARLIPLIVPIQLPDSPPLSLIIPGPSLLLVVLAVTLLSGLAGSLPALRAARLDPAAAIANAS